MKITADHLLVLLAIHNGEFHFYKAAREAARGRVAELLENGMLESSTTTNVLFTTAKGRAHIAAILKVPEPVQTWVTPDA